MRLLGSDLAGKIQCRGLVWYPALNNLAFGTRFSKKNSMQGAYSASCIE